MIRNLKALGLAVMAAFALSAVAASGAQALTVEAPGAVTVTGSNLEVLPDHKDHIFTLSSARSFTCEEVQFEGTITSGATEVVVTPTYHKCFSNGTQPTTVTHNECTYRFYGGTKETGNTHAFEKVTVDLECPAGKEIEVHVYASANTHAEEILATQNGEQTKATEKTLCTYNVAPFVEKHENTLTNTTIATHDVDVTTTVSGIAVTRKHGSALVCGGANQTATYTGATTLRAYSDTAHTKQVNLTVK